MAARSEVSRTAAPHAQGDHLHAYAGPYRPDNSRDHHFDGDNVKHCPPVLHPEPGSVPASTMTLLQAQAVLADMAHNDDETNIIAARIVRDESDSLRQQADAVATIAILTGDSR